MRDQSVVTRAMMIQKNSRCADDRAEDDAGDEMYEPCSACNVQA